MRNEVLPIRVGSSDLKIKPKAAPNFHPSSAEWDEPVFLTKLTEL